MSEEIVYGAHSVESLLSSHPDIIEILWLEPQSQQGRLRNIYQLAMKKGVTIESCSQSELSQKLSGKRHQGVAAKCRRLSLLGDQDLMEMLDNHSSLPSLILILDGVQDPHNLGACLRSAEAAGVFAVIIPKDNAATLTATVHKVSCGASWRIPLVSTPNVVRVIRKLQQIQYWVVGLDMHAENSLYEMDLKQPTVMILGAENQGLRRLTKENCDFLASIPMQKTVESLNVSVATGVCLFEAKRQQLSC